jgi:hypothetical protein
MIQDFVLRFGSFFKTAGPHHHRGFDPALAIRLNSALFNG